jgi:acetyltransferase
MFVPNSIAVVGATDREGSVGRTLLHNLLHGQFHGEIYAINPNRDSALGLHCYKSLGALPEKIDLAVIVTPAPIVPEAIRECIQADVRAAVVIAAGFKERGAEGRRLEQQIRDQLRGHKMRVIGPNCLGIMNPMAGLNATFAHAMAMPGNVAFLSQSGALETAILDWSLLEQVGFSAMVSTGSMLDVAWGDLIDYFGSDPDTHSILLYMESVGDARSFLSAAREVALRKPIIVIKAGRCEAASKAANTHTGALTGSDEVFDAALRRCGVLRVDTISDLFYMAETLARQPRPRGPRLTIVTNAGGPGVLATDSLIANKCELATLSESSIDELSIFLSPHWSQGNPLDILGDANATAYIRACEIALKDPNTDGLLAILAPQGVTDPASVAEGLKPFARGLGKPILASWMGGKLVAEGIAILNRAGIPTFSYPDAAARVFSSMWHYTYNLRGIYETPSLTEEVAETNDAAAAVKSILGSVHQTGRTILTEVESKQILRLYGIPTVDTRIARSPGEAVLVARALGFPVAVKLHSETVSHKTDVGGVKLNLASEEAVRGAFAEIETSVREKAGPDAFLGLAVQSMMQSHGYELILGSTIDSQFGPVMFFGSGGHLVQVYRDRALALPPLNTTLAQRLMEQTHIYKALQGVGGHASVDLENLKTILVRFSKLIVEQPGIKEIDINPLLATPGSIVALDARVILHPADIPGDELPRPAIRPYPTHYTWRSTMKDGSPVLIRPIRPEDEPLMVRFHQTISDRSVYLRYFHMEKLSTRVAHERLFQKCFIDYDREMVLVADFHNPQTSEHEILAAARLTKMLDERQGEVAVLVSDPKQGQGLGTELLRRLIDVARAEKLDRVLANIMPENLAMRALANRFAFQSRPTDDPGLVIGVLIL